MLFIHKKDSLQFYYGFVRPFPKHTRQTFKRSIQARWFYLSLTFFIRQMNSSHEMKTASVVDSGRGHRGNFEMEFTVCVYSFLCIHAGSY